jgi:hypothetical protein
MGESVHLPDGPRLLDLTLPLCATFRVTWRYSTRYPQSIEPSGPRRNSWRRPVEVTLEIKVRNRCGTSIPGKCFCGKSAGCTVESILKSRRDSGISLGCLQPTPTPALAATLCLQHRLRRRKLLQGCIRSSKDPFEVSQSRTWRMDLDSGALQRLEGHSKATRTQPRQPCIYILRETTDIH